jgi:hypothetical protein
MTDRPIIFSAPMILALLSGRKTMTRRLAWRCPCKDGAPPHAHGAGGYAGWKPSIWQKVRPGDRLWVRECFSCLKWLPREDEADLWYWADGNPEHGDWTPPKPSIDMPRFASRLTLLVTEVRRLRLQDISEEDAIAEGVEPVSTERENHDWLICPDCGGTCLHGALGEHLGYMEVDCTTCDTHRKRFKNLWDHLHGDGAWAANPEVIVLSFEVHQRNIDEMWRTYQAAKPTK